MIQSRSILSLVRPNILELQAYESARSLTLTGNVFLDANESPFPCVEQTTLNRYPEPQPRILLERFAQIYAVSSSMILLGRGSDEAIDLLTRAFCEPNQDQILICPPTYGMYEISAKIQGIAVIKVPLLCTGSGKDENFALDENGIQEALFQNPNLKMIFLCSPNNPTGTRLNTGSLMRICEMTRHHCVVVVDEAYIEFDANYSLTQALSCFPHLVILRTLSKAWAAAGVRCGVALAQENVIQVLQKIRAPYPLSQPAILSILDATDPQRQSALQSRIQALITERARLTEALLKLKIVHHIYPSSTNFILIRFHSSQLIFDFLKSKGIIVRDRGKEKNLANCIRITIGSESENQLLLTALQEYGA